jgi:RES domain-containing protein
MTAPVLVWRIAADTPDYVADDLTGEGPRLSGGRWNRRHTPLVYASMTRALACLETIVHFGSTVLPLNRYLVEIPIPAEAWRARRIFHYDESVGWDAEPAGKISVDWGTNWAEEGETLVAQVPSVMVPEESNVLINPTHPQIASISARKIRRWMYDARIAPLLRRVR